MTLNSAQVSGTTFDSASNSIVINTAGMYQVSGEVLWAANGSGMRIISIHSNIHSEIAADSRTAVSLNDTLCSVSTLYRLVAGERVVLGVGQTSGNPLVTSTFGGRSAALSVVWVAP